MKNLLAIAAGLTTLTSRSSASVEQMARELIERLTALGRAHDAVRPLPGHQGKAALLGDIIAVLLAPYDDTSAFSGRIRIAAPRMGVGENSATTLALIIHELATNSLKYGALSVEAGMLDVSGETSNEYVHMIWTERGGPKASQPADEGYGSKLLHRSVSGQLGGSIETDWADDGIVVTISMRAAYLAT